MTTLRAYRESYAMSESFAKLQQFRPQMIHLPQMGLWEK